MRRRLRGEGAVQCRGASLSTTRSGVLGVLALLAALLLTFIGVPTQASDTVEETRRVVILNATDPYLPAFLALEQGLRATIQKDSAVPVELYAETLDMHRFPRTLLDHDVVALLQKKYRGLSVQVVVAVAPIALDFARRHLDDIWPGARIVFSSVATGMLEPRTLDPDVIGVPQHLEIGETLDLALRLLPETRRVAVVSGTSGQCCDYLAHAAEALERHADRIDAHYLIDLSMADLTAAVAALPPDALVLYLTMFRDGDGKPQVPRDVLERISAVSPVPIFGPIETYLGHGIVGGSIASFEAQGQKVGQLAARVLNGADPAAIGIQPPIPSVCIADWQQLRRWQIDEDRLPAGCEVRFKDLSFWGRYHQRVLMVLAVILAQTALIGALLLKHRRLRHAQVVLADECRRRTSAEGVAAQLRGRLARFSKERSLGAMAAAIAHEINQPLIAIQNYALAAKRRIQSELDDKPKLIELFAKIEGQAQRAGEITQRVRSLVSSGEPRLQSVSLCPVLEAVIRMLEPEVQVRGCRIQCELEGEAPTVLADPLQVQLVLVNLLQNATQSLRDNGCDDKCVLVEVRHASAQEVEISVKDRGPGVPPDRVADIFEPLYTTTRGGMGMGLAISKTIVEAHDGRLWYEPNPEGGAIFRFTLRCTQPS